MMLMVVLLVVLFLSKSIDINIWLGPWVEFQRSLRPSLLVKRSNRWASGDSLAPADASGAWVTMNVGLAHGGSFALPGESASMVAVPILSLVDPAICLVRPVLVVLFPCGFLCFFVLVTQDVWDHLSVTFVVVMVTVLDSGGKGEEACD